MKILNNIYIYMYILYLMYIYDMIIKYLSI